MSDPRRLREQILKLPRKTTNERTPAWDEHPWESVEWLRLADVLALLDRRDDTPICPDYICAICYHPKDTCSHCDKTEGDRRDAAAPPSFKVRIAGALGMNPDSLEDDLVAAVVRAVDYRFDSIADELPAADPRVVPATEPKR